MAPPGVETTPTPQAEAPFDPFDFSNTAPSDDLSSAMETASSPQSMSPNMIGDSFNIPGAGSSGSARLTLSGPFIARFDLAEQQTTPQATFFVQPPNGPVSIVTPVFGTVGPFTNPLGLEQIGPPGGGTLDPAQITNTAEVNSFVASQTAPGTPGFNIVNEELQSVSPGATLTRISAAVTQSGRIISTEDGLFSIEYDGAGELEFETALFAGGGRPGASLGMMKVSENNSVMPRDRVIFNYNHFSGVPLTTSGININRYQFGGEKTFLSGRTSIQVVAPFASTLSSESNFNGGTDTSHTEFGNLKTFAKVLLFDGQQLHFAAGLGMELPTADDLGLGLVDGTQLIRIENESVHLQPFIGGLYTPTSRFFMQGFVQVDADASGNPVSANPDFTSLQRIGRLYGQTLLLIDGQVGYWIYQAEDPGSMISAVALISELHYNTTVSTSGSLSSEAFSAGDLLGEFHILNMTMGSTITFGERTQLQLATVFPLTDDRSFDFEVAAYLNYFFGPSTRAQRQALSPSVY